MQPWGKTRNVSATINASKINVPQAKPWEVFIWKVTTK